MEYKVLAYYWLGQILDPQLEVARHKEFLNVRDATGRIYISEQGINGQMSASSEHAEEYMQWLSSDERFKKIAFKIHPAKENVFPKMAIKYRKQLVAIDCPVDFSLAAEHVSPEKWKELLSSKDENTLILDVRNDYEWKIGRFEGAQLPSLETFRQFPDYARKLKEEKDPQKTRILMYCTGGIRCEFFSAVMKQEGFDHIYQLDGGVIGYGLQEGSAHWEGKLFVFDDRLAVSMDEKNPPISTCTHCSSPNVTYYNCANMDCNDLFLCCLECLRAHKGCCSSQCSGQERIRPYQESARPFRRWSQEEKRVWKKEENSCKSIREQA